MKDEVFKEYLKPLCTKPGISTPDNILPHEIFTVRREKIDLNASRLGGVGGGGGAVLGTGDWYSLSI